MPSYTKVPVGPYRGFTHARLLAEEQRNIQARQAGYTNLIGAGVNGQSFSFGSRPDGTLQEWTDAIYDALAYFNPGDYAPAQGMATRIAFR